MDSSESKTYGDQQGSAYNGHFECTCYHPLFLFNQDDDLERCMLPRSVKHWSLTKLREKMEKIGAKVVKHARYVVFQMAEVAVPRELFTSILARIARLKEAPA